jgi:hypothetical protein
MKNFFKKLKETLFFKEEKPSEKKQEIPQRKPSQEPKQERNPDAEFRREKREGTYSSERRPDRENKSEKKPEFRSNPKAHQQGSEKKETSQGNGKESSPRPFRNSENRNSDKRNSENRNSENKNSDKRNSDNKFQNQSQNQYRKPEKERTEFPDTRAVLRDPAKVTHGLDNTGYRKRENVSSENLASQNPVKQDNPDKLVKKTHGFRKKWKKPDQE